MLTMYNFFIEQYAGYSGSPIIHLRKPYGGSVVGIHFSGPNTKPLSVLQKAVQVNHNVGQWLSRIAGELAKHIDLV